MDATDLLAAGGLCLKKGVKLTGVHPALVLALLSAAFIYAKHGKQLWITSVNDSKHSTTSLHFNGCAADLRTRFFTDDELDQVSKELADAMGEDFDIITEPDHIHIEYQPRG